MLSSHFLLIFSNSKWWEKWLELWLLRLQAMLWASGYQTRVPWISRVDITWWEVIFSGPSPHSLDHKLHLPSHLPCLHLQGSSRHALTWETLLGALSGSTFSPPFTLSAVTPAMQTPQVKTRVFSISTLVSNNEAHTREAKDKTPNPIYYGEWQGQCFLFKTSSNKDDSLI